MERPVIQYDTRGDDLPPPPPNPNPHQLDRQQAVDYGG